MIFLKNFNKMEKATLAEMRVHGGGINVTQRVFADILPEEKFDTRKSKILQAVLDDFCSEESDLELEFPFAMLMRLEYGRDIIVFGDLPTDITEYLLNTPFAIAQVDLNHAIIEIRKIYRKRNQFKAGQCQQSKTLA